MLEGVPREIIDSLSPRQFALVGRLFLAGLWGSYGTIKASYKQLCAMHHLTETVGTVFGGKRTDAPSFNKVYPEAAALLGLPEEEKQFIVDIETE